MNPRVQGQRPSRFPIPQSPTGFAIISHALGWDTGPVLTRNYFVADEGDLTQAGILMQLVQAGYLRVARVNEDPQWMWSGRRDVYRVTSLGASWALGMLVVQQYGYRARW